MYRVEIFHNRKTQCKKILRAKLAIRRYLRYLHGNWKCASRQDLHGRSASRNKNSVLHVATRNLAPDFPRHHVRH